MGEATRVDRAFLFIAVVLIPLLPARLQAAPAKGPTSVPASAPASQPSAAQGAAYYVIPVIGVLQENAEATFGKSIAAARAAQATHVVLLIDSLGSAAGPSTFKAMLDQIIANDDLHWIAVVKQANWQTAALALTCPEILVTKETRIGGLGQAKTPTKDDPVLPTAHAAVRLAAQHGGRDELLARGMVERDIVLATRTDATSDDPQIVLLSEAGDGKKAAKPGASETILKPRGEVLVLTTDDAMRLGVAAATLDAFPSATDPASLDAIADALSIEGWHAAGSAAGAMSRVTVSAARSRYLKEHADRLNKIDRRTRELEEDIQRMLSAHATADEAQLAAKGRAAKRHIENVDARRKLDLARARTELRVLREEKAKIMKDAPK